LGSWQRLLPVALDRDDGRPFFDISNLSGVERSRDPPWGGQCSPITLAANDALSRRLRAGVRALEPIRRSPSAHRTIKVNQAKSNQNSERNEVRHGADDTCGTFLLSETVFAITVISIDFAGMAKVNPTKSNQIQPKNLAEQGPPRNGQYPWNGLSDDLASLISRSEMTTLARPLLGDSTGSYP
jgi:hypothetical protein